MRVILVFRDAFLEPPEGDAKAYALVLIDLASFCGTLPQFFMAFMPIYFADVTCGTPCHVSDLSQQFMYQKWACLVKSSLQDVFEN